MKSKILVILALGLGVVSRAAIIYPQAPEGGRQIVIENVRSSFKSDPAFLGGFKIEELTIAKPYRAYYVAPADLTDGKLASAARPGGWQYVFMHGSNIVGMEELIANEKTGGALRFNGLYDSNFSKEMMDALRMAEKLPQVKKQDYEVRRLGSPPLLFVSLWLHGKTDDIFIPLGNSFGRWNSNQVYSEREMLKLLKAEARKKLKEPPGMID